jgi:hypothetical protein
MRLAVFGLTAMINARNQQRAPRVLPRIGLENAAALSKAQIQHPQTAAAASVSWWSVHGTELAGILSMRDIVRVWTRDRAACDVLAAP